MRVLSQHLWPKVNEVAGDQTLTFAGIFHDVIFLTTTSLSPCLRKVLTRVMTTEIIFYMLSLQIWVCVFVMNVGLICAIVGTYSAITTIGDQRKHD